MATQAQIAAVQQLYVGYLGRAADQAGLNFWADAIANGTATIKSVATGFTLSTEYKAAYAGLTSDALVDQVYNNVLGRAADAEGKAFWVAALAKGTVTADTLVATIVTNLGALDQATINNKVFVAQTYTDTVGAAYNVSAGTSVLVGVDSTPASVTTALSAISTGTLAGQVPGLSLIKASVAAQDAVIAYGKTVATTNAALDFTKDGSVSSDEASMALMSASNDRALPVNGGTKTIATLGADVTNATGDLSTAKTAAITAVGDKVVTAYDNAVAVDTAADAAVTANAAAAASAFAGLNTAVTASGSAVTYGTLATAAGVGEFTATTLSEFLADPASSVTARATLVTELNKVPTYGTEVVKAGDLGLAAAKTQVALETATTNLTDDSVESDGQSYIDAEAALVTATATLANAQTADAKVAAIKVVTDEYAVLNKAATDAGTAITKFADDNSAKVSIQDIAGLSPAADPAKTVSDVFYFKSAVTAANDVTIASFAAGDSIVLGAGYAQGTSFAAGNNNALEYFFVKTSTGTQVVLETASYGSSEVTANATTGVAVNNADHLAVITLVGVTADHLSVANGVVSYV